MPLPITNDDELHAVAQEAGELLQGIQDYLQLKKNDHGRVRFPRGFIKPASVHREMLPQLHNRVLAQNISYALMTLDVLRWLAVRTDLSGQALEMVVKEAVCLIGSICEALTLRRGVRGLGRNQSFTKRTQRLVEMGVVDDDLKAELDWIWDMRRREHLAEVELLEWNHYTRADHNRARNAMTRLIDMLRAHYGPHVERRR